MIHDKALCAAMRRAWKAGGYMAGQFEVENERIILICAPGQWTVACDARNLPRKCIGLLAEHSGGIETGQAMRLMKDNEQMMLPEQIHGIYTDLLQTRQKAKGMIRRTGVTIDGCQLWQDSDSWELQLVDPAIAAIIRYSDDDVEPETVENGIFADMADAMVEIRAEDTSDYGQILGTLAKMRIE